METEKKIGLAEVWVGVRAPWQAGKVEHDLVGMLVVAVLVGADTVKLQALAMCCVTDEARAQLREILSVLNSESSVL